MIKRFVSIVGALAIAGCFGLFGGCGGPTPPEDPESHQMPIPEHLGEPPQGDDDAAE